MVMARKVKVKVKPRSIEYPSSTPGEKVRSCERSKEKASDSEKKPIKLISQPMRSFKGFSAISQGLSWIVNREGNKVYARDGNILFECHLCRDINKPMFFACARAHSVSVS